MRSTSSRSAARSLALIVLASASITCGGGGGGGGTGKHPTATLAFTPGLISAHYFHNWQAGINTSHPLDSITLLGTIDPVPTSTVYVLFRVDQQVFTGTPGLSYLGGSNFTIAVDPDPQLAPGTYEGNLTLELYEDPAGQKPYDVTGGTIPYSLTVDPELNVTATIDGVPASTVFTSSSTAVMDYQMGTLYWYPMMPEAAFTLHPGQVLELDSNVPVTWVVPADISGYGSLWAAPTVTPTSLVQVIASPPDGSTTLWGNPFVAMPADGIQWGAGLVVNIAE